MLVSYPALFYYDQSEKVPFFITFPDFTNSGTQGNDVTDAMSMATDWLGINVADYLENNRPLPAPSTLEEISLAKNNPYPEDLKYDSKRSFKSMVLVDLDSYLKGDIKIKKTVSIPKWADRAGADLHINYSATLTEAIAQAKMLHDSKIMNK
ncbi:type II toxin-antitoxin system HicB family antitoxin [Companilactobacillus futsaii]|uniref:type II toxin-antitoxin system HicB family antitoxin n=1 Tax=Companilactobacillus futsaii TaxID=938155 RepID=UPI0018A10953|nr:type II toxin-antitoxin system HicB family antitoxin [Companilactobacillus futsaii]